jgi:hypothetical protein
LDSEGWIEVLKERIESIRLQLGRLISHFDSEQRTSVRHGSDIDKNIIRLDSLERRLNDIEKRMERRETNWQVWLGIAISAVAVIISLIK